MADKSCDLLVIGTGAAAMSAALTAAVAGLKVIMVEKEATFGGASARSGGCPWIPLSSHARRGGARDSREAALTFFREEAGDRADQAVVEAFVDNAASAIDFLEANSELRFQWLKGAPDYHCDTPGGSVEGRVLAPVAWDGRGLGTELTRLRPQNRYSTFLGMQIGADEVGLYLTAGRKLSSFAFVFRRILGLMKDRLTAGRSLRLTSGNALIGPLAAAAFARGVELWTRTPARSLAIEGKKVVGAYVETAEGTVRVLASRGVVLATGGFPHDGLRRGQLFPTGAYSPEVWGMFPHGNSGDGIRMAEAAGAQFNDRMASPIALTPITRLNSAEGVLETMPCFLNRGVPGMIAVTRDGRRFTNEARSYHDFGVDLLRKCAGEPEAVGWLVFDHRYMRRLGNGPARPAPVPYRKWIRNGSISRGATLEELADAAGIDRAGLVETVTRYNAFAGKGTDPEFRRGSNAFDIAGGDPDHKPNPCVGPLDKAPFYAIRVFAGCVGTFAGIRTDRHARALDGSGEPIEGLYVVGNDMASITGGDYIAGGCTIGPGLTFGHLAARHAIGGGDAA